MASLITHCLVVVNMFSRTTQSRNRHDGLGLQEDPRTGRLGCGLAAPWRSRQ